jgi:hypothetical protein
VYTRAAIRTYDVRTGRVLPTAITHHMPVTRISLSQNMAGGIPERRVVFTDASQDLYISPLVKPQPHKIAAMVDTFAWNENCDSLCAVADGQCVTWLTPGAYGTLCLYMCIRSSYPCMCAVMCLVCWYSFVWSICIHPHLILCRARTTPCLSTHVCSPGP